MVDTRRSTIPGVVEEPEPRTPGAAQEIKTGPSTTEVKAGPTTTEGARIEVRAGAPRRRPAALFPRFSAPQSYTLLAMLYASVAIPMVFFPHFTAKFMFGKAADPVDEQHVHLLSLYASGVATAAAMAWALKDLARGALLHTYTADILKMGLIAHGVLTTVLMAAYPRTLSPMWVAAEGAAAAASVALPGASLLFTRQDRSRLWSNLRNAPGWAAGALRFPRARAGGPTAGHRRFSWLATLYNVLTLAFLGAGALYTIAPRWSLYHALGYDYGASTHYLWRLIGAGSMCTVLPHASMALKHKADIQRMASTPARTLNAGLVAASLGHLLVLGPLATHGMGGVLLPGIVGTWTMALMTSLLGLAAPEATALAEEVVEAATKAQ